MNTARLQPAIFLVISFLLACRGNDKVPPKAVIDEMNLKTGSLITCGPAGGQFGTVAFPVSLNKSLQEDFNLGIKMLHSFEYDEAEKVFAKIIDKEPACAMAYWGVAMCNFHPLWMPPTAAELQKGAKAIHIAVDLKNKSEREADYIDAIAAFYKDHDKLPHRTRCLSFEEGMERVHKKHPDDKDAAAFYALALNAAADPADKTFQRQKKAGTILTALYPGEPNHPGIAHYIIHTYDSPELAELALPAARNYAKIAPSSAHALHMPSHIFTRLGLWQECIESNLASVSSAQCYAKAAGIKGHWDEELHGMDYLTYAYLQAGQNELAKKQWDYLNSIKEIHPANFKVAYAFASIPSRYVLENRLWKDAASLKEPVANFSWEAYPWQNAIIHFTRALGAVHTGDLDAARVESTKLKQLKQKLLDEKDGYKANQVAIQLNSVNAWIKFKEGKKEEAIKLMEFAADMEDQTEKHPVTAGEVVPARELLGDMLLEMNYPEQALDAYEADLKKHPNRFNAVYSAGLAAEKSGIVDKTRFYYRQLLNISTDAKSGRPELMAVQRYFKNL